MKLLTYLAVVVFALTVVVQLTAAIATPNYVTIRLALKQHHLDLLESTLYEVSSPYSPVYGQFLTPKQIGDIIGTKRTDRARIITWLTNHPDIRADRTSIKVHDTKDYIDVSVPAAVAYEMVGTGGQHEGHLKRGLAGRFSAHPIASEFIDFAFFVDSAHHTAIKLSAESESEFANWKKLPTRAQRQRAYAKKQNKKNALAHAAAKKRGLKKHLGAPLDNSGSIANQRLAYGVPANLTCTNPNNHQMVWGTGTYGFTPSDLVSFYSMSNLPASEINELVVTDFYGQAGGDNWGEGTLDVSLISGIAPGIITLVSNTDTSSGAEEGDGFGPAMLSWMTGLINNASTQGIPNVISLSLGSLSWDSCNLLCTGVAKTGNYTFQQCSDYMQQQRQVCMYPDSLGLDRMNVEFIKLGTMGVTVVAATGDGGSHFSFQFFNNDPMGNILNQVACSINSPTFPAESPYVTGAGGTDWSTSGMNTPIAWASSGGGFSWRYPMPSYQQSAVENYLNTAKPIPPTTAFNISNRAYPDVATLANNVPVVMGGNLQPEEGTSCSAPEFSGLISLINDLRLNSGLKPLGFLNPTLYALAGQPQIYPQIFYDMSVGSSDCDVNGQCCNQGTGFPAAIGWDPTTGLGSPLFAGLSKYLMNNDFLAMFQ